MNTEQPPPMNIPAEKSPMFLSGQSMDTPSISVILPLKGPEPCLKFCLSALLRQDMQETYEVIVVLEEGDPLADQLAAERSEWHIVICPPNLGPGGARNYGITSARGQYLAFTDADCVSDPDWLRNLINACRDNQGGPVAGWMACGSPHSYIARASCFAELGIARPRRPRTIPGIWGNNMCVERKMLSPDAPGFAERVYGAEEIVFLRNLSPQAQQVVLNPAAQVRHMRRYRLVKSCRRMYRLGLGAGLMRKTMGLRGSSFARHRWLIPLMPAARMVLAAYRVALDSNRLDKLDFVFLAPMVFVFWCCYSAGFAAGASGHVEERFRSTAQPTEGSG